MHLLLKRYFSLLATYLKPQWRRSLLLGLLLPVTTALQLLNPQILKAFIDTAQGHRLSFSLLTIALLFIATALIKKLATIADTYLSEYIAWTATNQLRSDLVAHCLALDLSFHKVHTPGELIERIDGDVDTLSNFFSRLVIQLGGNVLLLVGIVAIFFHIDWRAGLGASIYILIALVILTIMRRHIVPLWLAERQVSADFYGFLGERLEGTAEIRANGATQAVMQRFIILLRHWFPLTLKARIATNRLVIVNFALISASMLLTISLGAYLHSQSPSTVTVGTIFAMYTYTFMLIGPLWSVQTQLQDLQQAEACIQRIDELRDTTSRLLDGNGELFPDGPLAIEFAHVTFGYEAEIAVLQNLSFTVQPGKVLGVLGRTGSGKTTLARLIFRLYDAQQGNIYLGGVPIQQAYLHELRRHIGLVTQDVQIFQATVRDNLTFFNPEISDEHILTTLADLRLSNWYQTLSDGLDTILGVDGTGLSAGEAQLLAFTRVFLYDPGIIILDEASSRLDPATESLLEHALNMLLTNRTAIIIAHRLTTLSRADDLLLLDKGALLEYGPYERLAHDPSSRFYHLQRIGLEEILA
jgi:ATP-binding cassette, subfamily B, bacterial